MKVQLLKALELYVLFFVIFLDCAGHAVNEKNSNGGDPIIIREGSTLESRYKTPAGYTRVDADNGSFAEYLRKLPLKPYGTPVRYYNGATKRSEGIYDGVVDLKLGKKNLQQCADAVIRLRAEYLFGSGYTNRISFHYTSGFDADFATWSLGNRPLVDGSRVTWVKRTEPSATYDTFLEYLDNVFTYAGTISLAGELEKVSYSHINAGDVFIQAGSPGHAVIVIDMAENKETGKKIYMLAQSYMPAQDIQILINPLNAAMSPWYELNPGNDIIITPQWTFRSSDLKRFIDR